MVKKLYWKIKNYLESLYISRKQTKEETTGCLSHKEDKRDLVFGGFWDQGTKYEYCTLRNDFWRYDQYPFNLCVFASAVQGASFQEGKRFSVRFAVQLAKRDGMTTRDGFSYLRAGRKIAQKYGRLPYELMPDETKGHTWASYSKYEITDEMLDIAAKYKTPAYKRVYTQGSAIELLQTGHVLFTANQWYSAMNRPRPEDYYMVRAGRYIGGHAWCVDGYRSNNAHTLKDFEVTQSFGRSYGQNGVARLKDLFAKGHFAVYMEEKILGRTDRERASEIYQNKFIKGSTPTIYRVIDGKKLPYANMEAFVRDAGKEDNFYEVSDYTIEQLELGNLIT